MDGIVARNSVYCVLFSGCIDYVDILGDPPLGASNKGGMTG